jgi:YfiH family protein
MMFMSHPQPNGGFQWTQEPWGAALECAPLALVARHLFTTATLRLVDDDQEWAAVARRMGVDRQQLRLIRQVHGVDVAIARAGTDPGAERPQADVILSDDPAVAIGVRVADCAAVLIADRRLGVVGAAHAGWRGTAKKAAAVAIGAMAGTFGSDPRDLLAAIGPCLGPCCGEMGEEVVEAFREAGHSRAEIDRWFARGVSGRPVFNLWEANRDQLTSAGLSAADVHVAEICTKTHPSLLHSYRADGKAAGRMAGVIRARGQRGAAPGSGPLP